MYFPTPHAVLIHKPSEEDKWGNQIGPAPDPFPLRCRADEKTQVVKNRLGEEVVSGVEFMFKGLPNISYDDQLEYTNELDVTIKRKPQLIAPARGLNGKPVYTAVYL